MHSIFTVPCRKRYQGNTWLYYEAILSKNKNCAWSYSSQHRTGCKNFLLVDDAYQKSLLVQCRNSKLHTFRATTLSWRHASNMQAEAVGFSTGCALVSCKMLQFQNTSSWQGNVWLASLRLRCLSIAIKLHLGLFKKRNIPKLFIRFKILVQWNLSFEWKPYTCRTTWTVSNAINCIR